MTQAKLAQMAGTSVATVSKAFAGSHEISDETRERIFALAKEIGCFDKYYKAPRKRPMIALMIPEPESEFYGREIGLLENALNARGADTVIGFTRFDPEREARLFREFAYGLKVDGMILWGQGKLIKNPDKLPLLLITSANKATCNADVVKHDISEAMISLVEILKKYGHRHVGFIGEGLTQSKETLLKNALRKAGLPVFNEYFVRSKLRFAQAGEDGMMQLIERNAVPQVIVAAYDQIAYGAIKCAEAKGYKIPDDISFVGIDDISANQYMGASLSSLYLDLESVCPDIVDLIFKKLENRHLCGECICVPAKVNVRQSLGKAKKKELSQVP